MARKKQHDRGDLIFHALTGLCAVIVILVMAGIFFELFRLSLPAMEKFGLGFLTSSSWNPFKEDFGAASSIYGTLVSTAIAMLIAVPLSLVIALFLVELSHPAVSRVVGYAIELLAAIPSIIYGMWGLFVFAPFLSRHVQPFLTKTLGFLPLFQGPPIGIGMMSAGIILALMVLPFTSAVMRDVFLMVPPVLKESAYGMGATTWEATKGVTLRYGLIGLVGASFLGLGRAIGETMAVTFVIGNNHTISASLFMPANSIPSTLANEFTEASDPVYLASLVELGLVLLVVTFLIQAAAQAWLGRIQRKMGGGA
jgi:phosphate transport system permease protein